MADGRREAQLLAGLKTEVANLSLQLEKVKDMIASSTPAGSAGAPEPWSRRRTQPLVPPTWQRLLIWAPVGALICTILAVAILLATARRDPRVRLRDEIADAVGSPVLAAVRSKPQRSVAGWSTLLATYEATPASHGRSASSCVVWFRPTVGKAEPRAGKVDHPQSLTMVSLSGDGRGIAVGPQLAAFASSLGIVTRLVTALGNDGAPTLWAAAAADRAAQPRPGLYVGDVPEVWRST